MKNLKLKVERVKKNLTQADVAEKIGVTRQTIHSVESNKWTPSLKLSMQLSQFFNKPVEYLFGDLLNKK